MAAQVRHRGPDALEIAVDGPVGLGHARLSIIDIAGGRQPMPSGDGSLTVTFNGEIFNYRRTPRRARRQGRRFRHAERHGGDPARLPRVGRQCVERFNGQWAFAIWDNVARRLFLSRDRLGIRPLYYTRIGDKLLFASEVKCLFADPDVERRIDPRGLDQVFTFWSPSPRGRCSRGSRSLPPGHNLTVERGRVDIRPYWRPRPAGSSPAHRPTEYAEQLLELLADATRLRLRADVPVGAYLSGGLDSSITAALRQATRPTPRCGRSRSPSTTTEFDESRYQREVADSLGTDHQAAALLGRREIADVFPEVVWHAERPMLRTAPAPLYLLSRLRATTRDTRSC